MKCDPLAEWRRKNPMAPTFNRRKASINNSFRKGKEEEFTSAEIKEKIEEFLKRGGSIEKLNQSDAIADIEIVANRNEKGQWSDETWSFDTEKNRID